jgi:hypothetical protein
VTAPGEAVVRNMSNRTSMTVERTARARFTPRICSAKFERQLNYLIAKAEELEKRIKSCRNPKTKELLEAHYGIVGRSMLELLE